MSDDRPLFNLTSQELACVRLAGLRLSNKEIAAQLDIAVGTVKNHLASAATKTGASGRLATARRLGLLDTLPEMHIPDDGPPGPDGRVTGETAPASEKPVRSWPLPAPPPRRHRPAAIIVFFVVGTIIAMAAVLTIWTTIRTAADMSPPNAIRALD